MARCLEETVSTVYSTRLLQEAYTVVEKLDGFVVAKCEADGDQCLVIHHKQELRRSFSLNNICIILLNPKSRLFISLSKYDSDCFKMLLLAILLIDLMILALSALFNIVRFCLVDSFSG